jgi:hypothetical protein
MTTMKRTKPKPDHTAHGITCPTCKVGTIVLYSRPRDGVTFRRRSCPKCGERFTTAEKIVNRPTPESSTGRTATALSITDLLRTLGLTVADLTDPVTIPPGDTP